MNFSVPLPKSKVGNVVALVGILAVAAVLSIPIAVTRGGERYRCGTEFSAPGNYRQYPRLYGRDPGRACQAKLDSGFVLFILIIGGFGLASVGAAFRWPDVTQSEPS